MQPLRQINESATNSDIGPFDREFWANFVSYNYCFKQTVVSIFDKVSFLLVYVVCVWVFILRFPFLHFSSPETKAQKVSL